RGGLRPRRQRHAAWDAGGGATGRHQPAARRAVRRRHRVPPRRDAPDRRRPRTRCPVHERAGHARAPGRARVRALDRRRRTTRRHARGGGRRAVTATLVVRFAAVGFALGWLLDPLITRVPLRQPILGPVDGAPDATPDEAGLSPRRVVVTVVTGTLFGAIAA